MKTTTNDDRFDDLLRALSRAPSVRPADIDLTGRKVGRFVVERRLGQGGMGVVYEASDPVLERKVALKVLRAGLRASSETRARLHEEARRVAALCHPNIATVYDVGEHEGIVFLAMERASGESLRARLAKPPALSFARALRALRAIASGLACAHDAGIIHRDLKPENVVTGEGGAVKIVDFGIAISSGERSEAARSSGRPAGTRRYMAPEISEGAAPSTRADVYAFGVLAREVLSATAVGARDRAARTALQRVLSACTADDPARRPRDGAALLAELEGIAAAPSGLGRSVAMAAGAAAVAATLSLLLGRTIPERHAATTSAPSARVSALAPVVADRAEEVSTRADEAAGAARTIDDATDEDASRRSAEDARANAEAASDGRPPAKDEIALADQREREPLDRGAVTSAVPVTTSVDHRGRLFAVVPLDAVPLQAPSPSGTMMPIAAPGSSAQAEVVADGKGGAVIHFTVRVKPSAGGSGSGGSTHPYSPGMLGKGVTAGAAVSTDPFDISKVENGMDPQGQPAKPSMPESHGTHGSVVCTAGPPSSLQGVRDADGNLQVFSERSTGTRLLVAIVAPDGEVAAVGAGATPCDDEDADLLDLSDERASSLGDRDFEG